MMAFKLQKPNGQVLEAGKLKNMASSSGKGHPTLEDKFQMSGLQVSTPSWCSVTVLILTGACHILLWQGVLPGQLPTWEHSLDPHHSGWSESPAGMLHRAGLSCLRGCLYRPPITSLPSQGTKKCSRMSHRQNSDAGLN